MKQIGVQFLLICCLLLSACGGGKACNQCDADFAAAASATASYARTCSPSNATCTSTAQNGQALIFLVWMDCKASCVD